MSDASSERSIKIGDHVRMRPRGKKWYAEFSLDGKQKRKSLETTSMKEARRKAIRLEADLGGGSYVEETRAPSLRATIDEYRSYLQTEQRAKATMDKYESAFQFALQLAERLKVRSLLNVDRRFLDKFRMERVQGGAGPKTVHTDSVIIRQVVNFALERQLIQRDPLKGLKIKKPKLTPQPCWTVAEVELILSAVDDQYRGPMTVLADTGMRVGELQHLTWDDVNFTDNVLHIRAEEGWKPKSGDERVVPMTARVRSVLQNLPRRGRWAFTARASARYPKGDHRLCNRRLLEHLKRVLKRLSLRGHVHTFRHYFISTALIRGTAEAMVRRWVGHVDAEVMKRYTHIADPESKAAMARLERAKQLDPSSENLGA